MFIVDVDIGDYESDSWMENIKHSNAEHCVFNRVSSSVYEDKALNSASTTHTLSFFFFF